MSNGRDVDPDRPTYFPALDGLRCLCATAVIVAHAYMVPEIYAQTSHPFHPLILQVGRIGVDIFFCLSGFLITYLLLTERRRYGRVDLKAFYIRRTLRIFPNYYVAVAAAFSVTAALGASYRASFGALTLDSFLAHLVFLGNWTEAPMLAGPLWSVCIEEQFYLIFPTTFVFSRRPHPVFLVALMGVLISVSVRALVNWPHHYVYHYTITRTDHLLLGATLAQLFDDNPGRVRALFRRLGGAGEFLALAAVTALVQTQAWRESSPVGRALGFTTSAVVCTFLVGQIALGGRMVLPRVRAPVAQGTRPAHLRHVLLPCLRALPDLRHRQTPWS